MIKAIIFDLDGVISDTQRLHASIEVSLLKKYGIDMDPEELTANYAGIADEEFFIKIFEDYGITADAKDVIGEKWDKMMPLAVNNILPIPGAIKIINDLKEAGFKLGVASSAPIKFIELVLKELKLKDKFQAITSVEDVRHSKPDPEIFLLTAQRLNANPEECVVIEDAESGMTAAKKAGMKCIGLVKKNDKKYPADLIVTTLKNLTAGEIINLQQFPHL